MDNSKTGVFSMDVVHQILAAKSLDEAKKLAKDVLASCGKRVRQENIKKANAMVEKSKNLQNIAFGMSNFIIAFQGEKVIK